MISLSNFFRSIKTPEERFRDRFVAVALREWENPRSAREYRDANGGSDQHPLWCGHFAAVCAEEAGLRVDLARHILPSTYRLASAEFADSFYRRHDLPELRRVDPAQILPGHIVSVKTSRNFAYGDHVVIPIRVLGDTLICVEGNARGLTAGGTFSPSTSVIIQARSRDSVRRVFEATRDHLR